MWWSLALLGGESPREGDLDVGKGAVVLKFYAHHSCPCGVGEHSQEIGALRRARLGLS